MAEGAVPDKQTVTPEGQRLDRLPEGVTFRDVPTHVDHRGSVCELFDPRWEWHEDPLVFVYMFTVRPGLIKGWGMHKRHDDRYFVIGGELEVVLYDDRDDSPTQGLVSKIYLNQYRRRLMSIPAGVWHADRNPGQEEAVVVNFPTIQYDHAAPDKLLLPLDTDEIPYSFGALPGNAA